MRATTSWVLITLFLVTANAFAQENPFLPQNLGEAVNSAYSEIKPLVSQDGQNLYFVRINHPENKYGIKGSQEIWHSLLQPDGSWSEAERMPDNINIGRYNALLGLSSDGKTFVINGIYNKKGTFWKGRGMSTIQWNDSVWGAPEPIKMSGYASMSKGLNNDIQISSDGKTMILSFSTKLNGKNQDLYISFMKSNGSWSRPRSLDRINTRFSEEAPFLSADNRTLYFASNRRSKLNYDIYKTERLENHAWVKWTTPSLMSDTINSYLWDSYFQTNETGSAAFFASINNSVGGSDIFQVKLFEENPFVIIKGKALNKRDKKPVSKDMSFEIKVNNQKPDSLSINPETAEYQLVLPLGAVYSLKVEAENCKSEVAVVNAAQWVEMTTVDIDLMVEPFDYVELAGKLLLRNTGQKISADANPQVFINGQKADSVRINPADGTYSVRLPFGKAYNLALQTTKYQAIEEQFDLTAVKEFRQVVKDLFAEEQKTATVTGRIYDKKTGKAFPANIPLQINVNDAVTTAVIDSTRNYRIELALGRTYQISASAENYYPMSETIDVSNETQKVRIYKDLYLVPLEVGQSIRLNNIFFETGKATLMRESFAELDRVVKFLNENPSIRIEIGGHTDNVGAAKYNLDLSSRRAKSVVEYIMLKGIPASAIASKGYGFTKPVASNTTAAGKQLNRRVEFMIIGK